MEHARRQNERARLRKIEKRAEAHAEHFLAQVEREEQEWIAAGRPPLDEWLATR
jgi:hypothetical protein